MQAWYGRLLASDGQEHHATEEAPVVSMGGHCRHRISEYSLLGELTLENFSYTTKVDVTIALQCLVKDSALVLHGASKVSGSCFSFLRCFFFFSFSISHYISGHVPRSLKPRLSSLRPTSSGFMIPALTSRRCVGGQVFCFFASSRRHCLTPLSIPTLCSQQLRIIYKFRGNMHEVTIDDTEELKMPMRSHVRRDL